MQSNEMQKLVYKDGDITKAITCEILEEDNFFVKIRADRSGLVMRIGKGAIVSIKPLTNGGSYHG